MNDDELPGFELTPYDIQLAKAAYPMPRIDWDELHEQTIVWYRGKLHERGIPADDLDDAEVDRRWRREADEIARRMTDRINQLLNQHMDNRIMSNLARTHTITEKILP